jgi:hypothetical protein
MLARGNPPDDWNALLAQCERPDALQRMDATSGDDS